MVPGFEWVVEGARAAYRPVLDGPWFGCRIGESPWRADGRCVKVVGLGPKYSLYVGRGLSHQYVAADPRFLRPADSLAEDGIVVEEEALPPAPTPFRWEPTEVFMRACALVAGAGGRCLSDPVPKEELVEFGTVRWSIAASRESCGAWSGHLVLDLLIWSNERSALPPRLKKTRGARADLAADVRSIYDRYSVLVTGAPSPERALRAVLAAALEAELVAEDRIRSFLDDLRRKD